MNFPRKSGILLHPTSLPGPYGIGEIGPEARKFVQTLSRMGQGLWQVLPLGPTSFGDSPYQSPSTFAGNHLLISFDDLVEDGLLSRARLSKMKHLPAKRVNYGKVIPERMAVLKTVCRTFERRASDRRKRACRFFRKKEAYWLDDYALFMAIKEAHGGGSWIGWPEELASRDPMALERARKKYQTSIRDTRILQYLFHEQWERLRKYARRRGIEIIGDIPIFVAHDSADVWANPDLFFLDRRGSPIVVAGVPRDYFSATGQLWGNPLYRWDIHHNHEYPWWVARMRRIFERVDIVRIDHFRGFQDYWEVPARKKTAMNGRWVEGPRDALFIALKRELGSLPIITEDLGIITDEVEALRDRLKFPGMRVLQFSFGKDPKAEDYKPHNYRKNCVVYTGTHDNDTTVGWFHGKPGKGSTRSAKEREAERRTILDYLGTAGDQIHWDFIALALKSPANTAVVPLQDVLGLDSKARMNTPGVDTGNWQWRFSHDDLTPEIQQRLRDIAEDANRVRAD